MTIPSNRIVVLIDMDCFFCQVETKLQPHHAGKPLAVVQYNQWEMGGIIAVNYEARSFGVTRHMRGKEAKQKCPDIVLVSVPCLRGKADISRYRKAGREVIAAIKRHCNVIERASVDEAYLDITDIVDKKLATSKISSKELILSLSSTYVVGYSEIGKNDEEKRRQGLQTWVINSFKELHDVQAQRLAIAGIIIEEIRSSIYKETGYRCSAGIAQNKILAKLACGLHKPNCQTILPEAAVANLYSTLPVKKVRNLGGKFGDVVIESLGCNVMGDLLQYSLEQLQKHFDEKTGFWLYNIARGIDDEPVINRLLPKSIGACKKFPGKQAITSLEVLKHWARDLAAEVCERLEEDFIENQRRATLFVISYHYYQNKSIISQTRSLTLNSYKPEKMAVQCVDVITKSTQCPVAFMGISCTKFVPSKESGNFLKFFKNAKPENKELAILDSSKNAIENITSSSEAKKEMSFITVDNEEVCSLKTEEQKSKRMKAFFVNKGTMKGRERIINNLNTSAEDSPMSKRVFKLIQVCNDKTKKKRLSDAVIDNNDFQDSFFMNVYKTEEKKCHNNGENIDTVGESKCKKQLIAPSANDENIDDYNTDLEMQESTCETHSTDHVHIPENSNNKKSIESNEGTSMQDSLVQLREIFPNLDDIDPDILSLLPANLQKEARLYMKSHSKKQEHIKNTRELPKTGRGRPSKFKVIGKSSKKRSPLYNFLIKTNSNEHDVPLERCAECDQMIPVTRFNEHVDFHVAQNLYQEINKPTSSESKGCNDMSSDSDSGDDWEENGEDHHDISCLFCTEATDGFPSALHHIQTFHKFNFYNFIKKRIHDTYSYIKLINFIRCKEVLPEQLNMLSVEAWDKDEYLRPVVEDDPWLMYDIEDLINIKDVSEERGAKQICRGDNSTILSKAEYEDMKRTIRSLQSQLKESETTCFLVKQQMEEIKEKAQKLILGDDFEKEKNVPVNAHNPNIDEGYFNTYSHFAIHHEMLTDKVRTESYRDALLTNSHKFHDCTMLDVGCGTGILSMFAAKSGCRKVISVDQSDVIYHAMDIVRENNLNDIINLKKGRLEDINIGVEKVDAIISEWMGYFLLFEGMVDTVIYARDHYLTPCGVILPNRCTISIVGSGDTKRYIDLFDYWSNVYGFKMSCMKAEALREPSIEVCNVDNLVTSTAEIQTFDLYKVTTDCVNFSSSFTLNVKKTGSLTAIIGYFDIFFDLENPVHFSTGPYSTSTHWKQTVFSLSEPISITEGEVINGTLVCRRHCKDIRGLMVIIHIKNFSQTYFLK